MKHILCIHLRNWPIDSLARRLRSRNRQGPCDESTKGEGHRGAERPTGPPSNLLIVHSVANRQLIVAADDDAVHLGIRPGQTLTEARARTDNLLVHPWQPAADARSLEALGRYLMRFTPVVATTTCDATDLFTAAPEPSSTGLDHVLYLDLTGCEHLFGGLDAMLDAIAKTLTHLRIAACLAVAPNPASAYALTFSAARLTSVAESAGLATALAPLPIASLRLDDRTGHLLHQLGIETIAQLLKLPRNQLASRFGPIVLQRIDQALGAIAEPLVPLPCRRPIEGRMEFEGPLSQPEAIEEAFRRVLTPLIEQCYRRGQGIRELRIDLPRPDEPPLGFSLQLSCPTRNPKLLLNLFRCAMEQQQRANSPLSCRKVRQGAKPPAASGRSVRYVAQPNFDAAFTGLHLSASRLDALTQQQIDLLDGNGAANLEQWQETLDRLRIRFGQDSIVQAQLVQSHLPEHACKLVPAIPSSLHRPVAPSISLSPHRPLTLLPTPQEIRVTVSPSDDRDGRPIQFSDHAGLHRVIHWVGPERIASQWWEGHNKTRDYFDVEDPAGRRHWIFRVNESGRWFLHGIFS